MEERIKELETKVAELEVLIQRIARIELADFGMPDFAIPILLTVGAVVGALLCMYSIKFQ